MREWSYLKGNFVVQDIPSDFVFCGIQGKELVRITSNGDVIVNGDVYEAAKAFWDAVIQLNPTLKERGKLEMKGGK